MTGVQPTSARSPSPLAPAGEAAKSPFVLPEGLKIGTPQQKGRDVVFYVHLTHPPGILGASDKSGAAADKAKVFRFTLHNTTMADWGKAEPELLVKLWHHLNLPIKMRAAHQPATESTTEPTEAKAADPSAPQQPPQPTVVFSGIRWPKDVAPPPEDRRTIAIPPGHADHPAALRLGPGDINADPIKPQTPAKPEPNLQPTSDDVLSQRTTTSRTQETKATRRPGPPRPAPKKKTTESPVPRKGSDFSLGSTEEILDVSPPESPTSLAYPEGLPPPGKTPQHSTWQLKQWLPQEVGRVKNLQTTDQTSAEKAKAWLTQQMALRAQAGIDGSISFVKPRDGAQAAEAEIASGSAQLASPSVTSQELNPAIFSVKEALSVDKAMQQDASNGNAIVLYAADGRTNGNNSSGDLTNPDVGKALESTVMKAPDIRVQSEKARFLFPDLVEYQNAAATIGWNALHAIASSEWNEAHKWGFLSPEKPDHFASLANDLESHWRQIEWPCFSGRLRAADDNSDIGEQPVHLMLGCAALLPEFPGAGSESGPDASNASKRKTIQRYMALSVFGAQFAQALALAETEAARAQDTNEPPKAVEYKPTAVGLARFRNDPEVIGSAFKVSALEFQQQLTKINAERQTKGLPPLKIRVEFQHIKQSGNRNEEPISDSDWEKMLTAAGLLPTNTAPPAIPEAVLSECVSTLQNFVQTMSQHRPTPEELTQAADAALQSIAQRAASWDAPTLAQLVATTAAAAGKELSFVIASIGLLGNHTNQPLAPHHRPFFQACLDYARALPSSNNEILNQSFQDTVRRLQRIVTELDETAAGQFVRKNHDTGMIHEFVTDKIYTAQLFEDDEIVSRSRFNASNKDDGLLIRTSEHNKSVVQQQSRSSCVWAAASMLLCDLDLPPLTREIRTRSVTKPEELVSFLTNSPLHPCEIAQETVKHKDAKQFLFNLRANLSGNGSATCGIEDQNIGGHSIVVDDIAEDLKSVRLRDPHHGWEITVTAAAFLQRVRTIDGQGYSAELLRIKSTRTGT